MLAKRIIPCLDVDAGRVVKGVNFVDLVDAGDPVEQALFYDQEQADELVFLDITATLEQRKTLLDAVSRTVQAIDVPLTVGGGIASVQDIGALFALGASKISINTAAVKNPDLVQEAAAQFGSERIVVAIDTRASSDAVSGFEVVVSGGTKPTGLDAVEWAKRVEALGAGAILPTSMDTDGTQAGYDLDFTRAIADSVKLPVIASGGAGKLEDFSEAVTKGKANVLLAASVFHFRILSIRQVKEYLRDQGIPVNL